MSFDALPTEMLQVIFSCTTLNDQKTIGLVCQRWAAAVEPLLLARTYLKLYRRVETARTRRTASDFLYDDYYTVHHVSSSPIQLIDKTLLMNSNRNYSYLRIDLGSERGVLDMKALHEVLDVCQERFPVQRLYFKAPFGKALADLLSNHRKLLTNLTELCFEQCDTLYEQSAYGSVILELSLPNLKQLTWHESISHQDTNSSYHHQISAVMRAQYIAIGHPAYVSAGNGNSSAGSNRLYVTLHVPELDQLKLRAKSRSDTNRTVYLGLEQANQCCLFLPSLNLKSCSKLQHLEISNLADLDQSVIDHSAEVLQSCKSLTLVNCNSQIIEKLCSKCSKLENLNIHSTSGRTPLQIFSVLPSSLQKLSLTNFPISFNDKTVLPELRFISLVDMITTDSRNKICLDAPKLTTIISSRENYNLLRIPQNKQIRTMVVDLNEFNAKDSLPPPNVTELFLCLKLHHDKERETEQDYLKLFPNLRRLTVYGKQGPSQDGEVELSLRSCPNLEYLCADGVTLRLTDFHELTRLKSLTLSDCFLKTNPDDGQIVLKELQYMRVRLVVTGDDACGDPARNLFPICGGDVRHPPPVVKLSTRIFGSNNFQMKQWHQLIPTN